MKYLLDTHILLWWYLDSPQIPSRYNQILDRLEQHEEEFGISIISLWEITKLISLQRIHVNFSLDQWFAELEEDPLLKIIPLSGSIILESSRLGRQFPKDPADQIIAGTARYHELHLMTVDQKIIDSGMVAIA